MWTELNRRQFLAAAAALASDSLRPKPPPLAPKATSIILLVTQGGMSQMDTFDPKPDLAKHHGKKLTPEILPGIGEVRTFFGGKDGSPLMRSPYKFSPRGESGMPVSEIFPELGGRVDDMAFLRSLTCDSNSHTPALFQMNTGQIRQGWPSLGSWLLYGLGSENRDLPGFCVMVQKNSLVNGGPGNWAAGFLGAGYQGTYLRSGTTPILHLDPPPDFSPEEQARSLDLLRFLNEEHRKGREDHSPLEARQAAYDLALRMQASMPAAADLSGETEEVKSLYGLDRPETEDTGRKCLMARRLVERGVRVVQIYSGSSQCGGAWDAHGTLEAGHRKCAGWIDRPFAALLKDLKRRGLLSKTLVVGLSEFGRMPISQGGTGRDHNPMAQTCWMAGAGVKPGTMVGATDELGYRSVEKVYHMRDLHATILRLMGLDDMALTYYFDGRNQRLTENGGRLIRELMA